MSIKVGINGFGRIGKLVFRHSFNCPDIDMIVVNDLMDVKMMVHLLKYDTVHGPFGKDVEIINENKLLVDGHIIHYYSAKSPSEIPWESHNLDYIIESSGIFTNKSALEKHFRPNIKRVVLSCPSTDKVDKNVVIGVNEHELLPSHKIISNTSCTTNCIAPLLKILNDNFGIEKVFMNTVHPYTNNQRIIDAPHKDFRRARAAAANIIPTTSSAINAVIDIMPHLKGKFDGIATRVPVSDGSLIELTALLSNDVNIEKINSCVKNASENKFKDILAYTEDPIVSSDIINNPHSGIFDALSTKVLGGNFVQLVIWYDNEFAYSKRLVELLQLLGKLDGLN